MYNFPDKFVLKIVNVDSVAKVTRVDIEQMSNEKVLSNSAQTVSGEKVDNQTDFNEFLNKIGTLDKEQASVALIDMLREENIRIKVKRLRKQPMIMY